MERPNHRVLSALAPSGIVPPPDAEERQHRFLVFGFAVPELSACAVHTMQRSSASASLQLRNSRVCPRVDHIAAQLCARSVTLSDMPSFGTSTTRAAGIGK